jgi:8-oxo-dGTP pyrophosphatase MutT (NUDIX family)
LYFRPSAGAVVVKSALPGEILVLGQARHDGEHQLVAPRSDIEADESTLAAAIRAVREQTGATGLTLLGYLGQQRSVYRPDDDQPGEGIVDWFLLHAAEARLDPTVAEGSGTGWYSFQQVNRHLAPQEFIPIIDKADAIAGWRASRRLGVAPAMHSAVAEFCRHAHGVSNPEGTALVLCGSAARGDYVDGWSDLDFIAYTKADAPTLARELGAIAKTVEDRYGVHVAVRAGDTACHEVTAGGPLYNMKLRAVARRVGADSAVISGRWTGLLDPLPPEDIRYDLEVISAAARLLLSESGKSRTPSDSYRRALSVMCSSSRLVAYETDPAASFLLPDLAELVDSRWEDSRIAQLLRAYDQVRTSGNVSPDRLASLALAVPETVDELSANVDFFV